MMTMISVGLSPMIGARPLGPSDTGFVAAMVAGGFLASRAPTLPIVEPTIPPPSSCWAPPSPFAIRCPCRSPRSSLPSAWRMAMPTASRPPSSAAGPALGFAAATAILQMGSASARLHRRAPPPAARPLARRPRLASAWRRGAHPDLRAVHDPRRDFLPPPSRSPSMQALRPSPLTVANTGDRLIQVGSHSSFLPRPILAGFRPGGARACGSISPPAPRCASSPVRCATSSS